MKAARQHSLRNGTAEPGPQTTGVARRDSLRTPAALSGKLAGGVSNARRKGPLAPANHLLAGAIPPAHGQVAAGAPLPAHLHARFATTFDAKTLHAARIHTDPLAAVIALMHRAHAVAKGEHIYFAEGRFRPGTAQGDFLLAHELAHVAQAQQGLLKRVAMKATDASASGPLEVAADSAAAGAQQPAAAKEPSEQTKKPNTVQPAPAGAANGNAGAAAKPVPGANLTAGPELVGPASDTTEAQGGGATTLQPKAALPRDLPIMPEPALSLSAKEKQRLAGVQDRAATTASATSTAPKAQENVSAAQAAVEVPQAESDARAAQQLVADLAQLPPPSQDIVDLCKHIRTLIKSKRPADEEGVIDTRPQEVAQAAGQSIEGNIQTNVDDANASYDGIKAKPAGPAAPAATPAAPIPSAVNAAPLNANAALPDAVPAADASLDNDAVKMDQKAADAGLNKDTAQLVQGGPIADARDAQGELKGVAKDGPEQVLAQQKAALKAADSDMIALQAKALGALTDARKRHVSGVDKQQGEFKGGEEALRAKLAADAERIYTEAQTNVQALLKPVSEVAMQKWTKHLPLVSKRFNDDLQIVKSKIDTRHSGVSGFFVAGWDAVTGLPRWAEDAYDAAEKNFGDDVCNLILEISQDVNLVIDQAKKLVKQARDDIHELLTKNLPDGLKSWATEQEKGFGKKLDALDDSAEKTRSDFNKELIENAGNAVQAARERIQKLREEAGGLWGRFLAAVGKFLDDPVKFIIEGLLELLGIPPPAFWAVIAKIKSVVHEIVDAPLKFANNLLDGVAKGFSSFFDNIAKHLLEGLLEWLLSGLKDEGLSIEIPKEITIKSTVSFFLQLLGISWARIRKLLVEQLGEKAVAVIEKTAGVIYKFATKGIAGVYEEIKAMLDPKTIVDAIVKAAIDYIVDTLIVKVAVKIIAMLNPAGAILAALEAIYRVLKWIFTNAARIFHFVEAIVNGMADVLAGNIGNVAKMVEKALAMLIAPVIDFLADYLGLGGLPGKIAKALKGLQGWVEGVMRSVIKWLVDLGKKMLAAMGLGGKDKDKGNAKLGELGESLTFTADGHSHRLFVKSSGASAQVMVASSPLTPGAWLDSKEVQERLKTLPDDERKQADSLIAQARPLALTAQAEAEDAAKAKAAADHDTAANPDSTAKETFEVKNQSLDKDEESLASLLQKIGDLLGLHIPPEIKFEKELSSMPEGARGYALDQVKSNDEIQAKDWTAARDWLETRSGFRLILGEGSRVGNDTEPRALVGAIAVVTYEADGVLPETGADDAAEIVARSKPKVHKGAVGYAPFYGELVAYAFQSNRAGAAEASATTAYDFVASADTRFVLAEIPTNDEALIASYDSTVIPLVKNGLVRGNAAGLRNQFEGTVRAKRYIFSSGFRLQMQQILLAATQRQRNKFPQLSGVEVKFDSNRRADYTQRHSPEDHKHVIHEVKNWAGFDKKDPDEQREIITKFTAQAEAYLKSDAASDGELLFGGLVVEVKGPIPLAVTALEPRLQLLAFQHGKLFRIERV